MKQGRFKGENQTDVIISGAGIVGLVMAGLLAKQNIKVTLIESKLPEAIPRDSIDPRALAITPASRKILESINVWQTLPDERLGYFESIEVWDQPGSGHIQFHASETTEAVLGYIIEVSILEQFTRLHVIQSDQVTLVQPASINHYKNTDGEIVIGLDNGMQLSGRLLIAADGARSKLRNLTGIAYQSQSYQQSAVAGIVQTQCDHGQTARQWFSDKGILALLPLAEHDHCGFVWSTDTDYANQLISMDDARFLKSVTEATDSTLGDVIKCLSRQSFPLYYAQAEQYCLDRIALIGDAAHSVHPLAGQGANLGILDAAILSDEIEHCIQHNRDYGLHRNLRRFERRRRSENILMMNVFSGFKNVFEAQTLPLPWIRSMGMGILNNFVPAKRFIMHRAMGLTGDVPETVKAPFYF